jgi:hypothetical protein
VQNDIDENKCKPGQYFVLKFDLSTFTASPDLAKADRNVIKSLNEGIKEFYETYATHFGQDVTSLCGNIDIEDPSLSLQRCSRLVRRTLLRAREQETEQLASVQGIYLRVDEYDAFPTNYLETHTVEPREIAWNGTAVGQMFRSFWPMVKSLSSEGIQKVFITGVSPLSLSGVGSGFNVASNLSFH